MKDVLAQMGRPNVGVIDRNLGFELCRREGIQTIVLGSYVKAGEVFATDVKVLDVDSKTLIKSASARGQGVGSILQTQIDALSREIARAAGLSERRIGASQPQITDVTTKSMEAYSYYLKGRAAHAQHYDAEAKRYLEKAVALDSTFATAYLYLALADYSLFDRRASAQAFERAKALADRATERERLTIEALYADQIEKDPEKERRLCQELTDKYPDDKRGFALLGRHFWNQDDRPSALRATRRALELDPDYVTALNMTAYIYAEMDSIEQAVACLERYAAVAPEDANAFDSMGDLYYGLGRIDEAAAAFREALEIKPDFRSSALKLALIAALREDYEESRDWIDALASMTPGAGMASEAVWWKAVFDMAGGRLEDALTHLEQSERLAASVDFALGGSLSIWLRGWIFYAMGDMVSSSQANDRWADYCAEHYPASIAYQVLATFRRGLIELQQGQPDSTRLRLAAMQEAMASVSDERWRELLGFRYGLLRTELLLNKDSLEVARVAAGQLQTPETLTHSMLVGLFAYPWCPMDVVARAYLRAGDVDQAIAEYELMTTSDLNRRGRRQIHPIYHLRLGQLYEARGSDHAARREYEKFLEIWRDADEGLPALTEARTRLAALGRTGP
jgi:tetratricopeptide (TPR) repeat protein